MFVYNKDFVISRFCSIDFIATLAGLKNIVRYTELEDFVISRFDKSRFYCNIFPNTQLMIFELPTSLLLKLLE